MRRTKELIFLAMLPLFIGGCLTPVSNEIPLVGGDLSVQAAKTNETKLVIFNDSNRLIFGIGGAGRINVRLDGKGVAQLDLGEYAQVITSKGQHRVDLEHRDIGCCWSQHSIELKGPESLLRIYATALANQVKLVPALPSDFGKKFKPIN